MMTFSGILSGCTAMTQTLYHPSFSVLVLNLPAVGKNNTVSHKTFVEDKMNYHNLKLFFWTTNRMQDLDASPLGKIHFFCFSFRHLYKFGQVQQQSALFGAAITFPSKQSHQNKWVTYKCNLKETTTSYSFDLLFSVHVLDFFFPFPSPLFLSD